MTDQIVIYGVTVIPYQIVAATDNDGGYYVQAHGVVCGWFRTRERAATASRQMAWGESIKDDTPEPGPAVAGDPTD